MKLLNKVALISGGGRGMGKAIASKFYNEGAFVHLIGRREKLLKDTCEELGGGNGRCTYTVGDISDIQTSINAVKYIKDTYSKLHILVNNAGTVEGIASAGDTTIDNWRKVIDTNLNGPFFLINSSIELMIESSPSSIINISSVLALGAAKGSAAYIASKSGLRMLSKSVAIDYAAYNVRCNCICPSSVETPMYHDFFATVENPKEEQMKLALSHPLGRIGQPIDIANAAAFLASDEASWITGVDLVVDGGLSMVMQ